MALSEDQLKAMEASAPLLVAEYRKLQGLAKEYLRAQDEYCDPYLPSYDWVALTRGKLRDYLGMD